MSSKNGNNNIQPTLIMSYMIMIMIMIMTMILIQPILLKGNTIHAFIIPSVIITHNKHYYSTNKVYPFVKNANQHESVFISSLLSSRDNNDNNDNNDIDEEEYEGMEFPGSINQQPSNPTEAKLNLISTISSNVGCIETITDENSPLRYLLPIATTTTTTTTSLTQTNKQQKKKVEDYVMIDVPPYTPKLHSQIQNHCQSTTYSSNDAPIAILITNQNSIYYNDGPGVVYKSHRSDLQFWIKAFPNIQVVIHRIDMPREYHFNITIPNRNHNDDDFTRPMVTQVLDGYGPWSWDSNTKTFKESGRPLTIIEWDDDKVKDFFEAGLNDHDDDNDHDHDDDDPHPYDIRSNEENKSLLAIYTPGHTMGSMCYILPKQHICASGFTIPPSPDNPISRTLDYKGYITTNRATIDRQVQSLQTLKHDYLDRFSIVLPSRGSTLFLNDPLSNNHDNDNDDNENHYEQNQRESLLQVRKERLDEIITQFQKIGKIYESLGITNPK